MKDQVSLSLGIVLERRRVDNPWQDFDWRPVAVIPGAPACDPAGEWRLLGEGENWIRYHSGTLSLELFRRETEGYKFNLTHDPPRLFVVLHGGVDVESEHDVLPFLVTACPYEAQDYLDSGEDIVEAVTMPAGVVAFVQDYIDRHHVDEPFKKRKRKRHDPDEVNFARRVPTGPRRNGHG